MKHYKALLALTASAVELGVSSTACAITMEEETKISYRYTSYNEDPLPADVLAQGSAERYTIDVHQFRFKTPLSSDAEIAISATKETMTGASPWYILPDDEDNPVQVMSGATIEEERTDASINFATYSKRAKTHLSFSYSSENDYDSISFALGSAFELNKKRTTFEWGLSGSQDYIDATDADIYTSRPTNEVKKNGSLVIGLSQVATKNTLINSTVTYSVYDGFLSDTYKQAYVAGSLVADSRPSVKAQTSWALLLRQFVPAANAALHLDYRYYTNDWGVNSHTLDLAWYQNFPYSWQLAPRLRFYSQSEASFYQPFYTQERIDNFYSSDFRLSDYSAVSAKILLTKSFTAFNINLSYEAYRSRGDSPSLVDFSVASLGMSVNF